MLRPIQRIYPLEIRSNENPQRGMEESIPTVSETLSPDEPTADIHTALTGGAHRFQLLSSKDEGRLYLAWHSRIRSASDQSALPHRVLEGVSTAQRYQANCEAMAVLTCSKPISKVNLVPRPKHNTAFMGFIRVNNQGDRNNIQGNAQICQSRRMEQNIHR
ncbi:hypothetical protein TNCV_2883591 [Trichonephila clavipes]|nr:hypothetical protein TNCV_2883591 [Trichonephila clavipes]